MPVRPASGGGGAETDPVYLAGGATDIELAAAVATLNTALAAKQASATAATDAELAAAVATLNAAIDALPTGSEVNTSIAAAIAAHAAGDATDAELASAVASLTASIALKQDAATAATDTELAAHTSRTDNPHSVTKAQVGLANVDNTSDAAKPVSTAQQTALDLKQNAATAATDTELAAEASARASADSALDGRLDTLEAVDNATQAELNTHKSSSDHDGRYYTEAETDTLLDAKEDALAGTVNGVTARILVTPDDSTDQNGVVVKCPSVDWGDPDVDDYGSGQAFMVLKEGSGGTEPYDFVMFRVDRRGAMGVAAGAHFATGLRARAEDLANITYSIRIQPQVDVPGILVDAQSTTPASAWQQWRLSDGTKVAEIDSTGALWANRNAVVANGSGTGLTALSFRRDPTASNDLQAMVVGTANQLFSGTAQGDAVIRAVSTGGSGTGKLYIVAASSSQRITINSTGIGFFGTTPAARPTGVAVTAAGIHAALVTLGLITA